MLVLSRKPGQNILIEGGIRITFLGGTGNRVRLGIEAPKSLTILRGELEGLPKPQPAGAMDVEADQQ